MAYPPDKRYPPLKPYTDELAKHFELMTAREIRTLQAKLKSYLAVDFGQLKTAKWETEDGPTTLINSFLKAYEKDSKRQKELAEALEIKLQKEAKERQRKIESIIKKSCKVKKLTLCLRLENYFNYEDRLNSTTMGNYAKESTINDQLRDKLLDLATPRLEIATQYKPYPSTLFKQKDFEYYIEKTDYLSKIYYVCESNSITKLEHLRVQNEINSKNISQDYATLKEDFKIHQNEISKVNTILAKLGSKKYAELKDYITKINPKQDKNTAADIVLHPDNCAVMEDIRSIEKRILKRIDRKNTDNARKKLYAFSFTSSQLSRKNFLSYDSSVRHELIDDFLAQDDQYIEKIIQSKKDLKYTKSEKPHEISIPKALLKKIKKLAGDFGIHEQLLINIIFLDDDEKHEDFTARFAKPLTEKTLPPSIASKASYATGQQKHLDEVIEAATSETQAITEPTRSKEAVEKLTKALINTNKSENTLTVFDILQAMQKTPK